MMAEKVQAFIDSLERLINKRLQLFKLVFNFSAAVLSIAFIILLINRKEECPNRTISIKYVPMMYAGEVIDVYPNKSDRGLISLKIRQNDTTYIMTYLLNLDFYFYQDVKIGDSLFKEKGALDVMIKGKEGIKLYKYKCP